jgi:hypothetical protein
MPVSEIVDVESAPDPPPLWRGAPQLAQKRASAGFSCPHLVQKGIPGWPPAAGSPRSGLQTVYRHWRLTVARNLWVSADRVNQKRALGDEWMIR